MLRLRGAFDPKRFYKSVDNSKFPKYFQMGTVVEGPTDYYSGAGTFRNEPCMHVTMYSQLCFSMPGAANNESVKRVSIKAD